MWFEMVQSRPNSDKSSSTESIKRIDIQVPHVEIFRSSTNMFDKIAGFKIEDNPTCKSTAFLGTPWAEDAYESWRLILQPGFERMNPFSPKWPKATPDGCPWHTRSDNVQSMLGKVVNLDHSFSLQPLTIEKLCWQSGLPQERPLPHAAAMAFSLYFLLTRD